MNWLIARLRESSSWRGIIWLLTACGVTLRPEIWEQVVAVGMAVAGLLGLTVTGYGAALWNIGVIAGSGLAALPIVAVVTAVFWDDWAQDAIDTCIEY